MRLARTQMLLHCLKGRTITIVSKNIRGKEMNYGNIWKWQIPPNR